jgi:hypothetical protein
MQAHHQRAPGSTTNKKTRSLPRHFYLDEAFTTLPLIDSNRMKEIEKYITSNTRSSKVFALGEVALVLSMHGNKSETNY